MGENLLLLRMGLVEVNRALGTLLGVPMGDLSSSSNEESLLVSRSDTECLSAALAKEGERESSSSLSRW